MEEHTLNIAQLKKVVAVLSAESHVHFDNIIPNWLVAISQAGEVIELASGMMLGLHWTINTSESRVWEGPDIEMVLYGDMHMFVLDLLEIKYAGQPAAVYRKEWDAALEQNGDWMSEHPLSERHKLWPAVYNEQGKEYSRVVLLAVNLYYGELQSIQRFIDHYGTADEIDEVYSAAFIDELVMSCQAVGWQIELTEMEHYPRNEDGSYADRKYEDPYNIRRDI